MGYFTIKSRNWSTRLICFFIISLLFFPGCSMMNKITGKQPEKSENSEAIPKQLEDVEASIEKIFGVLKGPSLVSEEANGQSEQTQTGEQNQAGSSQSQTNSQNQTEGGSQQKEQSSKSSSGQTNTNQAADPFQQAALEINKLHYLWNEVMPEINKKGAPKKLTEDFSNSLNNLTESVTTKDKMKIMLALNALYAKIPDVYALYKTNISPEIKNIIYYSRSSILFAESKDWGKASVAIKELKSSWAMMNNALEGKQRDDSSKLDLSILELEKVVQEQNTQLVQIKGKITLANIAALQKSLQEAQQSEKQKK